MILRFLCGAAAFLAAVTSARADSSVALESALGFTSNANLTPDSGQSDRILKVGGTSRFPLGDAHGRASLRYTDYGKFKENDLFSGQLGTGWQDPSRNGSGGRNYDFRAFVNKYVHQNAATTDQAFSHYGVTGTMNWDPAPKSPWKIGPRAEVRNYTSGSRTDFDVSFPMERSAEVAAQPGSSLDFGIAPGWNVSTASDFSKAYLALSADYEVPLASSLFGAYLYLTPSWYTSRSTSATVLTGKGRRAGSAIVVSKESTVLLSPGVWWSKDLTRAWEFRAETFLNLQSSKSGSYSYDEFQAMAAIRYRVIQ